MKWELPNIGEGVQEADVADILVAVGDRVETGHALMELETDKAVVELPAPGNGIVQEILVKSGDTIRVGEPFMVVSTDAGGHEKSPPEAAADAVVGSSDNGSSKDTKPANAAPEKESSPAPAPQVSTEMVTGSIDFQLPPLGEGVKSADVAEILVAVGDTVKVGDALMELETEKAVVELPSEHAGKVTKIHVAEGDTVNVGAVVVTFEASEAVASKSSQKSSAAPTAVEAPVTQSKPAPAKPTPPSPAPQTQVVAGRGATNGSESNGLPVPAAPSTRRLARELGVDLREVKGTGSGGRISQEDVQAYVKARLTGTALSRAAQPTTTALAAGSIAPPPLPDFSKYGLVQREKMNKLARTAAENLTVSWNVIPHVTQHDRADITDLEAARKRFSQGLGKNGPKVTMTAIVIKALTTCLQAFPKFNSSLDPETNEIVLKKFYNIGCAVDTENGLVVPVIKNCDQKSILQIAAEVTELAVKARDRKLSIDDMQGATCTVTNLGGIGGVGFTPIVNYPEVCILGMSRGQSELQLVDGQVRERLMLPVSLSYDHRVINGADAARFVVSFCNLLSDPFQLLTTV